MNLFSAYFLLLLVIPSAKLMQPQESTSSKHNRTMNREASTGVKSNSRKNLLRSMGFKQDTKMNPESSNTADVQHGKQGKLYCSF
jgi:hypothetical protein